MLSRNIKRCRSVSRPFHPKFVSASLCIRSKTKTQKQKSDKENVIARVPVYLTPFRPCLVRSEKGVLLSSLVGVVVAVDYEESCVCATKARAMPSFRRIVVVYLRCLEKSQSPSS